MGKKLSALSFVTLCNQRNHTDRCPNNRVSDKLIFLRHTDAMNSRRVILEMHYSVERDVSTSSVGKWTEFAGLEGMVASKVPPQRVFAAQVSLSLVQRQAGIAKAVKTLVRLASQRK